MLPTPYFIIHFQRRKVHRTPLVIVNWKMYGSAAEVFIWAARVRQIVERVDDVEVIVLPPIIWLPTLVSHLYHRPANLRFGVQNIHPAPEGAFTGEISVPMVKGLARYVLVGHSERRTLFGETDETVNEKLHAVLGGGLHPILCVGELTKVTLEKRGRGRPTRAARASDIFRQLDAALAGVTSRHIERLIVCYEPLWAISPNRSVPGAHADEVLRQLRARLAARFGATMTGRIRTVYGGNVTAENIGDYHRYPNIDGVLVGAASRDLRQLATIVTTVAERVHHVRQHIEH